MKTALILSAIICGFVTGGVAQADVMVKVRSVITVTPSNPDVENPSIVRTVYYVHGKMRRRDSIDRSGSIVMDADHGLRTEHWLAHRSCIPRISFL